MFNPGARYLALWRAISCSLSATSCSLTRDLLLPERDLLLPVSDILLPQTAGCWGAGLSALPARSARSSSDGSKQRYVGVCGWRVDYPGVGRGVPGGGRGWAGPHPWAGFSRKSGGGVGKTGEAGGACGACGARGAREAPRTQNGDRRSSPAGRPPPPSLAFGIRDLELGIWI
eukprot:gene22123-biopygen4197